MLLHGRALLIAKVDTTTSRVNNTPPCPEKLDYLVIQANLQRSKLATQDLLHEAQKRKARFALIQEPYVGAKGVVNQYTGVRIVQKEHNRTKPVKAAILVFDDQVEVIASPTLTNENIAVAILKTDTWNIVVTSVYFEDHLPIEPYLEQMKLVREKFSSTRMLMGGDCNSWSE